MLHFAGQIMKHDFWSTKKVSSVSSSVSFNINAELSLVKVENVAGPRLDQVTAALSQVGSC